MQPRYDEGAECAIIGASLLDQRVMEEFFIRPEDFYLPAHEQLWAVMVAEQRAGRPVQPITISQELITHPIPGMKPDYLHQCLDAVTTASVAPHYAAIVSGLANLRRISDTGSKLIAMSQESSWEGAEQVIDDARATLDATAGEAAGIKVRTFSDALKDAVEIWTSPKAEAFRTGWTDLDRKLNGGWHPGQLTIIGARPAVGKSVVASCAAVAASAYGAGFFSLEMREDEIVGRMSAAAEGIRLDNISSRHFTDGDWRKLANLATKSAGWPIYLEDKSTLSMAKIRAQVRTWLRRGPVPLVIIDYLQLVQPADRSESRERQVSRIAEDCKHLAKEFGIHVVALAQVNRASTNRENKRPTESDLRESGGIEAFADNIILLHRDDEQMDGEIEFIIAKNRHGETGSVRLAWRPHFASVNSMTHEEGDYRHGIA